MLHNLRRWRGASSFEDDVTFVTARIVPTPGPLP
jgi:hypothetical protein